MEMRPANATCDRDLETRAGETRPETQARKLGSHLHRKVVSDYIRAKAWIYSAEGGNMGSIISGGRIPTHARTGSTRGGYEGGWGAGSGNRPISGRESPSRAGWFNPWGTKGRQRSHTHPLSHSRPMPKRSDQYLARGTTRASQ
jgi:hypothetical protein